MAAKMCKYLVDLLLWHLFLGKFSCSLSDNSFGGMSVESIYLTLALPNNVGMFKIKDKLSPQEVMIGHRSNRKG